MKTAKFLFDFGSPNAYLAHKLIPGVAARAGARFDYVPVLLGGVFKATGNQSPMAAYAHIPAKLAYEMKEMERFVARHRVAFAMNPHFPVNTLAIMRGAVAAQADGVGAQYIEAVFDHMWRDPKKMDDPDVIRAALDASGLDGAGLIARAQDPAVKAKLAENTERAVARGVFGAPSFFVGDEMWFGKDRLGEVEAALAG